MGELRRRPGETERQSSCYCILTHTCSFVGTLVVSFSRTQFPKSSGGGGAQACGVESVECNQWNGVKYIKHTVSVVSNCFMPSHWLRSSPYYEPSSHSAASTVIHISVHTHVNAKTQTWTSVFVLRLGSVSLVRQQLCSLVTKNV